MKTQDIKTFSDQLHKNMKEQLEVIAGESPEIITKANKSLFKIKSCLGELKGFVHRYQFSGKQEEIEFFKEIKPVFASQYYYYEKLVSIKIREPLGSNDELLEFYNIELRHVQKFVNENPEFYRYCLSNATHLDDKYFVREHNAIVDPDVDGLFSTGYDSKLAMLLANQMVKEHLLACIKKTSNDFSESSQSTLTWTGPKTALIELIYALQSTETFNNGKADLKLIATSFESIFNVSLGNYYRVFQEIRIRKSGKTNFLDQLKNKFLQRMDESDQN